MIRIGFFLSLLFLGSCDRLKKQSIRDCELTMDCSDDCLFSEVFLPAKIKYYPCYGAYGVRYPSGIVGDSINGLTLDMPEEFRVSHLGVRFSATFFEFDLPLVIFDPASFGPMYRIELCEIFED